MVEIAIKLSDQNHEDLDQIARMTGKSEDQLVREAVDQFISKFHNGDRVSSMRKAKGIWKDRKDLPALEDLRRESNRDLR